MIVRHFPFLLLLVTSVLFHFQDLVLGSSFLSLLLLQALQYAALFGAWRLLRAQRLPSEAFLWVVMITIRLLVLPSEPWLEDDHYRYLWDGRVLASGVNPFRFAPDSAELDFLHTSYRELINYMHLPTIYPPLAQIVFAASHSIFGDSLLGLKAIFALFDFSIFFFLRSLLSRQGASRDWAWIYAFHPLVFKEVYNSAHFDIIPAALSVASLHFILQTRGKLRSVVCSWALLALAVSSKFYAVFWLPFYFLRGRFRFVGLSVFVGVVLLLYLPFLAPGVKLLGSLGTFSREWTFNESLFAPLASLVEGAALMIPRSLRPSGLVELILSGQFARMSVALLLVLLGLWRLKIFVSRDRSSANSLLEQLSFLFVALFLLSPVVNPWYMLWALPLWILRGKIFWIFAPFVLSFGYSWFENSELYHFLHYKVYALTFLAWGSIFAHRRIRAALASAGPAN